MDTGSKDIQPYAVPPAASININKHSVENMEEVGSVISSIEGNEATEEDAKVQNDLQMLNSGAVETELGKKPDKENSTPEKTIMLENIESCQRQSSEPQILSVGEMGFEIVEMPQASKSSESVEGEIANGETKLQASASMNVASEKLPVDTIANVKMSEDSKLVENIEECEPQTVETQILRTDSDEMDFEIIQVPIQDETKLDHASKEPDGEKIADEGKKDEPETTINVDHAFPASDTVDTIESNSKADAKTKSPGPTNGLSLLAAYDSEEESDSAKVTNICDSDEDAQSVVEVPITDSRQHRKQAVQISSDSDDSSSTDTDSEGEYLTVLRKEIDKKINTDELDEDDEDFDDDGVSGDRPRRRQPPKVRGEMLLDELPPIEQLEITVPEDECVELGKVQSIVDQLVLVSVLPNSTLFDLDTVLFLDKGRKVLGKVFDVLGQVADPMYCVRFNSNKQIQERGINIGDVVYCAPQTEHTQFVILSKLMQMKGSDASWEHDVEPPPRYVDYSDDEAERDARLDQRKKRQRERTNSTDSVETVASTSTVGTSAIPTSTRRPQRGRRSMRESQRHAPSGNYDYQNSQDSHRNYHPSYNPGSWHSNYYPNYHAPMANFNMPPPGMHFPMPNYGYGMPPSPYGMPQPMMQMPPATHMYPPYGHPQPPQPPNSGS